MAKKRPSIIKTRRCSINERSSPAERKNNQEYHRQNPNSVEDYLDHYESCAKAILKKHALPTELDQLWTLVGKQTRHSPPYFALEYLQYCDSVRLALCKGDAEQAAWNAIQLVLTEKLALIKDLEQHIGAGADVSMGGKKAGEIRRSVTGARIPEYQSELDAIAAKYPTLPLTRLREKVKSACRRTLEKHNIRPSSDTDWKGHS